MEQKRRILITGADGFLGGNAREYFERQGHQVVGSGRTPDLSTEDGAKEAIEEAARKMGGLDGVFHAAGAFVWSKVADLSATDASFLINANFVSSLYVAKMALPHLARSGNGRLVFVSAAASLAPAQAGMGVYIATKAALNSLIEALAAEWKESGATVNAICPTIIDTPRNRKDMPSADFSTWVTAEQLMGTVEFLFFVKG